MMKKKLKQVFSNQHGSVINVALLILILIFLIGIGLSNISTTDIKIANNIKQSMTTFYEADAGLDAAGEMIEQNLACITGFTDTPLATDGLPNGEEIIGGSFYVNNLEFSHNARDQAFLPSIDSSDADFYYPPNYGGETDPHTNITVGGVGRFSKGSAIQMAAGYEGMGKGAAAGGSSIIFDVYAERVGINNTSSIHFMQWIHIITSLGECNFD